MKKKIKILILEDNSADAELMVRELKKADLYIEVEITEIEKDFVNLIKTFKPDVILSDYMLPTFDGMEALAIVKELSPDTPFIIVTGSLNEETAAECIKKGAWDYVIKQHLVRLAPAVKAALKLRNEKIERRKKSTALEESEQKYRELIQRMHEGFMYVDNNDHILFVNKTLCDMFGYTEKELIGKIGYETLILQEDQETIKAKNKTRLEIPEERYEIRGRKKSGEVIWLSISGSAVTDETGEIIGSVGLLTDITDRKLAEAKFQTYNTSSPTPVFIVNKNGDYTFVNPAASELLGYSTQELLSMNIRDVSHPDDHEKNLLTFPPLLEGKHVRQEISMLHKSGKKVFAILDALMMDEDNIIAFCTDITERQHEEELQKVLFNISEALTTTSNLNELYASIHNHLSTILDVTNFYIVLYNKKLDRLEFPYHSDEKVTFEQHPADKTLSGYVIKTGKPLFADIHTQTELKDKGIIGEADKGTEAKIWMGVPLKHDEVTIGVIAVQNYSDENAYSKKDMHVLQLVSHSVALGIERKLNEEVLRKSEDRFQKMLSLIPDTISIHDPDMNIVYSNWKGFASVPQEKRIINSKCYNTYRGYDDICPDCQAVNVLKTKEPLQKEVKLPDGSWFDLRVIPLIGQDGCVELFVEWVRDITHRKQMQMKQEILFKISKTLNRTYDLTKLCDEIRSLLGQVMDTTNFFVALYDEDNDIISLPYDVDEKDQYKTFPAGKTLAKYVIDTAEPLLVNWDEIEKMSQQGIVETIGTPSKIWMGVPLILGKKVIGMIALQSYDDPDLYSREDISVLTFVSEAIALAIKRTQSEEALKESESLFRNLFQKHAAIKLLIDPNDGQIVDANEAAADYYGWSQEELRQMKVSDINTLSPAELKLEMDKARLQERVYFEFKHRRSDGTIRDVAVYNSKIETAHKDLLHSIVIDITDRKQAEETLQSSEVKYRSVVDNMTEGLFVLQGMKCVYANPIIQQISGLSEKDIEEKTILDIIYEEDKEVILSNYKKRLNGEKIPSYDFRIQKPNGDIRWLTINGARIQWKNEPAVLYFVSDITERKRAEQKLKQSEMKLQETLEATTGGIWEWNLKTGILHLSPRYYSMLGYEPDEFTGTMENWTELIHPEDRESAVRKSDEFLKEGMEHYQDEFRMRTKTGAWRWILSKGKVVEWDKDDRPVRAIGSHEDITYQKLAELEAERYQKSFINIVESSIHGILILDDHKKICYINPEAKRMLEKTEDELLDRPFEYFDETKETGEIVITHREGRKLYLDVRTTKVKWEGGDSTLVLLQDLTSRKQAEIELRDMNAKLEELRSKLELKVKDQLKELREKDHLLIQQSRHAAMGEMISNIAHQWRQPLTAVGAIVQDIEEAFKYDELNEEYLRDSIKNTMDQLEYMSHTIDDFRNFFMPNREKTEFSINKALEKTLEFIETSFKNNAITLNVDIKDECLVEGFSNEYTQVILNILNNAKDAIKKHTPKDPWVNITLENLKGKDYSTCLTIDNNGGRIPDDVIDKIFDPYFSTKDATQGTGLGLYMSKMIIEKNMNGQITVKNIKDGVRFKIFV